MPLVSSEKNSTTLTRKDLMIVLFCLGIIGIFIWALTSLSFTPSADVYIFNPYMKQMAIKFDDNKAQFIAGSTMKKTSLDLGRHQMKVWVNDKMIYNEEIEIKQAHEVMGAFINLTKNDLMIYSEKYQQSNPYAGMFGTSDFELQVIFDTIIIPSEPSMLKLNEEIKVFPAEQLVLVKDWDFDVNQALPNTISFHGDAMDLVFGKTYKKLFTVNNFLTYIEEYRIKSY